MSLMCASAVWPASATLVMPNVGNTLSLNLSLLASARVLMAAQVNALLTLATRNSVSGWVTA